MCTAIHQGNFFGRNLDYEFSYGEHIIITPKNFTFSKGHAAFSTEFAILGMGIVAENHPLYFDAMNEAGLCMAGLNFCQNAEYLPPSYGADNVASFDLIAYILGRCKTVSDAKRLLTRINITDKAFSEELTPSSLHWMIADRTSSVVVEPLKNQLKVTDNPVGVLTNNPPFDYHLTNLSNYMNLTKREPQNRFSEKITLTPYSRGMGAMGLPGDLSSSSRFVKAAFTLLNSAQDSLCQFFHILKSVEQQMGCAAVGEKFEYTIYSSCCDMEKLIYYYTTYENSEICAVCFEESDALITYPLKKETKINYINKRA